MVSPKKPRRPPPVVASLSNSERTRAFPKWGRDKFGRWVCPACDFASSKPEAHHLSAVCLSGYEHRQLKASGYRHAGNRAKVVLLAGFKLRLASTSGVNVTRADFERVIYSLWAPRDILALSPLAPDEGLTKLSQELRAAVLKRTITDPTFGAYVDSVRRLGGELDRDKDFRDMLRSELAYVAKRQARADEFMKWFRYRGDASEVAYLLCRLRAGLGLPPERSSFPTRDGIMGAVVHMCLKEPAVYAVALQAELDRADVTLARFVLKTSVEFKRQNEVAAIIQKDAET